MKDCLVIVEKCVRDLLQPVSIHPRRHLRLALIALIRQPSDLQGMSHAALGMLVSNDME